MVAPLLDMEGTWEEVAGRAPAFSGRKLRVIVLSAEQTTGASGLDVDSLDAKLAAIAARIPAAEQAKLPPDFCDQLDHYIYGAAKQ